MGEDRMEGEEVKGSADILILKLRSIHFYNFHIKVNQDSSLYWKKDLYNFNL